MGVQNKKVTNFYLVAVDNEAIGGSMGLGSIQFLVCKRNLQKILNKTIRNASPPLLVLCRFWYFENHCSVKAICPK